jgi:hypothetical protein
MRPTDASIHPSSIYLCACFPASLYVSISIYMCVCVCMYVCMYVFMR